MFSTFSTESHLTDDRRTPWWERRWLLIGYIVATVIVTFQRFEPDRHGIFALFQTAFFDLIAGRNLYEVGVHRLGGYRYSPTFALLFGPLAILPFQLGVALWNVISIFGLYAILGRLLPRKPAQIARLLVLGDLVRSMQSSQSNALVTTLIIAAFLAYEDGRAWRGAWAVAGGAAIKIFPAGAALFALIRPFRWRAVLALAAAGVVFALAPMAVTGPARLLQEYHWWFAKETAEVRPMYAVMDLVDAWTGRTGPRWPTQLAGLVLLLLPVAVRRDAWSAPAWRLRLLSSVLVFCVLFNYGAESQSYVIAMTGIAVWWVTTPASRVHNLLLLLTLVFSTLARSSLVPVDFRMAVLDPPRTIVMPVLAAWLVMQVELLRQAPLSGVEAGQDQVATIEARA